MNARADNVTTTLEEAVRRRKADVGAERHIPFAHHVTPSIIKMRNNGDLCCTWRLAGIPFQTAGVEEIATAKRQLVSFVHSLRSTDAAEPTAQWFHRVRRKATDRLHGKFPNAFAQTVDSKFWSNVASNVMLRSEYYFTLVVRPTRTASGWFNRFKSRKPEDRAQEERALILYASGRKMESVARRMGVRYETAKGYIDRVRHKYAALGRDVRTKTQLYQAALSDGLIEPP